MMRSSIPGQLKILRKSYAGDIGDLTGQTEEKALWRVIINEASPQTDESCIVPLT